MSKIDQESSEDRLETFYRLGFEVRLSAWASSGLLLLKSCAGRGGGGAGLAPFLFYNLPCKPRTCSQSINFELSLAKPPWTTKSLRTIVLRRQTRSQDSFLLVTRSEREREHCERGRRAEVKPPLLTLQGFNHAGKLLYELLRTVSAVSIWLVSLVCFS